MSQESGRGLDQARRLLRAPSQAWWGSLPLRVVGTTLIGTLLVLVLGGWLLQQQAAAGIEKGKVASSLAEASTALDIIESSLRDSTGPASTTETITRAALGAVDRGSVGGQYQVLVSLPTSDIRTEKLDPSSVSSSLRQTVQDSLNASEPQLYWTSTQVRYLDGTDSVPGIVVGAVVGSPGANRYPVFFVFPMWQEQQTLRVVQQALITTSLAVVVGMMIIAYWVSRAVITPVRSARQAAERLASGQLADRMPVRGTDDLARLAVSMNYMASELQHRIRQLEELSRLQQRFVADVSHELRTPLTTVRLAADVIYDGRESFPALENRSAVLMRRELDRFEALLADLLEISRFDAGAAELILDEQDLCELVRAEVDALRPLAATRGVDLELKLPDSTCAADIDQRRIGRVLRNLLTNAIEHGEGRPVEVEVALNQTAVALTVRDHGVGFDASDSHNVFERFWRADRARARSIGGTGLGLAIAMEDVRLHGGNLAAWGRPMRGAQFRVTLPRRHGTTIASSPLPLVPRDLPRRRPVAKAIGRSPT
ncbi:MAG: HAMP domain-containing histidine kinase [Actinobacteria bacterium]|nr:HAMP domain-containing histidine kinase [Actinomycetota bacterium]